MDLKPLVDLVKYIIDTKEKVFAVMLLVLAFVWFLMNQRINELIGELDSVKLDYKIERKEMQKKIDDLNKTAILNNDDCQAKIDKLTEIHNERYDLLSSEYKNYVITTNKEFKAVSEDWKREYQQLVKRLNNADQVNKTIQQKIKINKK